MRLTNVFVVPGIAARLFSCRWGFDSDNIGTRLEADLCLTLPTGEKVPFVPHGNGLHYNILALPAPKADILLTEPDALNGGEADRWHGRLAHLSLGRVHKTLSDLGIKGYSSRHDPKSCLASLATRCRNRNPSKPNYGQEGQEEEHCGHFGQRIDSDLCGPFESSDHDFTYAINFVDRYSRLYAVYFLHGREHPNVLDAAKTFMRDHAYLSGHCCCSAAAAAAAAAAATACRSRRRPAPGPAP